jgi:hypothetical protein
MAREYKLKKGRAEYEGGCTNIMKINLSSFDIKEMDEPVKLYRDFPQVLNTDSIRRAAEQAEKEELKLSSNDPDTADNKEGEGEGDKKGKGKGKAGGGGQFRKKTKLYYNNAVDYQETRHANAKLRYREYKPWIFEDSFREYSFVGKFQPQDSNYFLFVYENDEFHVIPVDNWYKFNTRINYRTLTTEEAELQMKRGGVSMDKWMMHKLTSSAAAAVSGEGNSSGAAAVVNRMTVVRGEEDLAGDIDEMLYGDHFEDDEEYGHDIGEDQMDDDLELQKRNEAAEDRRTQDYSDRLKQHIEVKDTQKLLKKMKQDFLEDGDEDEVRDPYAGLFGSSDTSDDDEDAEDEKEKHNIEKEKIEVQSKIPMKSQSSKGSSASGSRSASPATVIQPKRKSPNSPDSSPSTSMASERPMKKVINYYSQLSVFN